MQYRGVIPRAIAFVIDMVVSGVIFMAIGFLAAPFFNGMTNGGFHLTGIPALIVMGSTSLLVLAYFVILEGMFGKTIGKALLGIKVVSEDGSPAGISSALVRNILRIIDVLPFLYILGIIFMIRSDKEQRLGDKVSGTVVVSK